MDDSLRQAALDYHRFPRPGKLAVVPTKAMCTERDLALAYSPGVAIPCEAIARDPDAALDLTNRGNLVGVITNGTAVLGLGALGPLASKPVMEGKAALFKKLAGIDVFDLEIAATDPATMISIVRALEPTFGCINLEDIRAPDCFEIEEELRASMGIPVFHDDQHGTAIVCAAAIQNALLLQGKALEETKVVTSGAGAAAIASIDLLVSMGLPIENVTLTDVHGVVHRGREPRGVARIMRYARQTDARRLDEVLKGADIFLGLSAPNVLKPEWLPLLAEKPVILALANPTPEICPTIARQVRPDAIVATGRSDEPNQVNNVLCFPYILRGALDVGATDIDDRMKRAATEAIANLARMGCDRLNGTPDAVGPSIFGPEYVVPRPFDRRLLTEVAPAVAAAAMAAGIARRPIDIRAYRDRLACLLAGSQAVIQP